MRVTRREPLPFDERLLSLVLLTSLLLRIVALIWSLGLLARLRDWRMAFLSAMLGLMALRQGLALGTSFEGWRLSVSGQSTELPGLIVSGLALGSVFYLQQMLLGQRRTEEALRASRAQLAHSQKMEAIGRLAGGVAHDFNNVLTAVLGFAEILKAEIGPDGKAEQLAAVDEILQAAERASELTSQLLTFSRKDPAFRGRLGLNEAIDDLQTMLRRLIGEDVRLEVQLDPQIGAVGLDAGQAQQVLTNLIVNARDAMPSGGVLRVTTDEVRLEDLVEDDPPELTPGPFVRLRVSDTGTGIDDATRERLFEPFFTSKAPGEGTGLGLSTVYGIVRRAEGTIRVESAPGLGATFEVLLPRLSDPTLPGRSPRSLSRPSKTGGLRVLLAEDEPAVASLVESALTVAGHEVVATASGEAALQASRADERRFDLLVSDVVMPGMSGIRLARELRRERPDLPVVLMSGYPSRPGHSAEPFPDPVVFLAKPFGVEELRQAVIKACPTGAGVTGSSA